MAGLLVVALEPAPLDTRARYLVRLGPLKFTCVVGEIPESLGDKLEAVGAALTPGERTPRPAQITLPIRGDAQDADDRAVGIRLRRQVRALLNNRAWQPHGLYFEPAWDPDAAAWLGVSGGDLAENARGVTFGDWQLTLGDSYLLGRPATLRRGRRVTVADRADGSTPSDTRRLLVTTDLSTAAPAPAVPLPGPIAGLSGQQDREPSTTAGPTTPAGTLWRTTEARDGETITWRPTTALPARDREAATEHIGTVRAWVVPAGQWTTNTAGDLDPAGVYGWERLLGQLHDRQATVAIENGWTRARWIGGGPDGGLLLERLDQATGLYLPVARVSCGRNPSDVSAVEITAERAIISWRDGGTELRAELRRAWAGPRLEAYAPAGALATIAIAAPGGTRTAPSAAVDRISTTSTAVVAAKSHSAIGWTSGGSLLTGQTGMWQAPRVLALQTDLRDGATTDVAQLARWDVRPAPTLVPVR